MPTCEHCNREFKTKSSLNYHQKTAKYCLKERGEILPSFDCKYCSEKFTRPDVLSNHMEKCSAKSNVVVLNQKIEKLSIENEKLLPRSKEYTALKKSIPN